MTVSATAKTANNLIAGSECGAASGETIEKLNPATGELLSLVPRSDTARRGCRGVGRRGCPARLGTRDPRGAWPGPPPHRPAARARRRADRRDRGCRDRQVAQGRTRRDRRAIEMGYFVAGEGAGCTGRSRPRRFPTVRSRSSASRGVAGLIIAANTPIANVAWKVFPALMCGNAAVLKASRTHPKPRSRSPGWRSRRACRPVC